MVRLFAFSVTGIVIGGPAFAHTGVGDTAGFVHGFIHPIGGLDHVLAMVAVGLFAALLGGRALWLVPFSFVSMMAVGGALGMGGVALPFAEFGIGLSVVAFGVAVAFRLHMPIAVAMALAGFFAVFHGHAHGAEMPDTASGFEYAAGFLLRHGRSSRLRRRPGARARNTHRTPRTMGYQNCGRSNGGDGRRHLVSLDLGRPKTKGRTAPADVSGTRTCRTDRNGEKLPQPIT
jgi:urease accessory protein